MRHWTSGPIPPSTQATAPIQQCLGCAGAGGVPRAGGPLDSASARDGASPGDRGGAGRRLQELTGLPPALLTNPAGTEARRAIQQHLARLEQQSGSPRTPLAQQLQRLADL